MSFVRNQRLDITAAKSYPQAPPAGATFWVDANRDSDILDHGIQTITSKVNSRLGTPAVFTASTSQKPRLVDKAGLKWAWFDNIQRASLLEGPALSNFLGTGTELNQWDVYVVGIDGGTGIVDVHASPTYTTKSFIRDIGGYWGIHHRSGQKDIYGYLYDAGGFKYTTTIPFEYDDVLVTRYSYDSATTTSAIQVNGGTPAVNISTAVISASFFAVQIGNSSVAQNPQDMYIGEVLIYPTKLSAGDSGAVLDYLTNKWRAPVGGAPASPVAGSVLWLDFNDGSTVVERPGAIGVVSHVNNLASRRSLLVRSLEANLVDIVTISGRKWLHFPDTGFLQGVTPDNWGDVIGTGAGSEQWDIYAVGFDGGAGTATESTTVANNKSFVSDDFGGYIGIYYKSTSRNVLGYVYDGGAKDNVVNIGFDFDEVLVCRNSYDFAGTTMETVVNSMTVSRNDVGLISTTFPNIRIGSGASSTPQDTYVGEILIYPTKLSASDSAEVLAYLEGKWKAPPAEAPTEPVAGSSLWLDFNDETALSRVGGLVDTATSKVENLTPAFAVFNYNSATTRPATVTTDGRQWLWLHDTSNEGMTGPAISSFTGSPINSFDFFVVARDGGGGGRPASTTSYFNKAIFRTSTGYMGMHYQGASPHTVFAYGWDSSEKNVNMGANPVGKPFVARMSLASAAFTGSIDRRPTYRSVVDITEVNLTASNMTLGALGYAGGFPDLYIGEVLAYPGKLSDVNADAVIRYLQAKWGVPVGYERLDWKGG